jgi:ATP-dependent DNA ligase
MAARIEAGRVKLLTRSGLDWTARYPATAAAFAKLKVKTAYIDGELCGVRPDGVTSFELMQTASDRGGEGLTYFAFDLLALDSEDVSRLPLTERQKRLRALLKDHHRGSHTATMPRAAAKSSAKRPASMGLKGSSRSGSTGPICPATRARGSRPSASTGPSSWSWAGRPLKDRGLM